jgi:hypothetical protein
VGQQLSAGLGSQIVPALAPGERIPAKVVWRPLPAEAAVPARPAPAPRTMPGEIVDVTWSAIAAPDPEEIIATVRAERMASWGGSDHPHAASGCGYCRRATAAYR